MSKEKIFETFILFYNKRGTLKLVIKTSKKINTWSSVSIDLQEKIKVICDINKYSFLIKNYLQGTEFNNVPLVLY